MTAEANLGTGPAPSIPFNRPGIEGREIEHIREAVQRGHTSADGPFTARVSQILAAETGASDVLLTTSCTAALEMSAMLLEVGPGDTVVVPSFGFVTTALAFVRQGARIAFCDIERETLGLDPAHLERLMDETVRAVVPIHYSGIGCDLAGIEAVLENWPRAQLVEDNAHGLFGRYRDRPLGSFGRFATLSFHETKNFICGEGGALLLNRAEDAERAHVLYHKGTNRTAFLHGLVDKYSWQDTGSSFGLSDVLAAYLYGQLEERTSILARRRPSPRSSPIVMCRSSSSSKVSSVPGVTFLLGLTNTSHSDTSDCRATAAGPTGSSSNTSVRPPVGRRANKRAASTFVSLSTRRSPDCSSVSRSRTVECSGAAVPRSTSSFDELRSARGTCAIRSVGSS